MHNMSERINTGHEKSTSVRIEEQTIPLELDALLSAAFTKPSDDNSGEYADLAWIMGSILKDVTQNPEREEKYKAFLTNVFKLKTVWKIAGLPKVEERFQTCILIYFQQRLFDDVIDGDTPEKLSPVERVTYAKSRLTNLKSGHFDAGDPMDAFAVRILSDIAALDKDYVPNAKQRLGQIMHSIAFDGERISAMESSGTWEFSSYDELKQHFFDLDIDGVIGLTLFLFGFQDSKHNMDLLTPLGESTRIAYNVRDFASDIKAGLCNIPREDADRLNIAVADLQKVVEARNMVEFPQNVSTWLLEQVAEGKRLLTVHVHQPAAETLIPIDTGKGIIQKTKMAQYRKFVAGNILKTGYIEEAEKVFAAATRELR
jgi:hypothetical protein